MFQVDVLSYQKLLVPLNFSNSHWCLVVVDFAQHDSDTMTPCLGTVRSA